MASDIISRDNNQITVLAGVTDDASAFIKMLPIDPTTGRLKVSISSGAGLGDMLLDTIQTVTAAKTFNDGKLILAGATSGTTVLKSAAVAGSSVVTLPSGTVTLLETTGSAANLTSFPTLNQNTTGSAATLTTARTIGGVSFNGSANITVASATGGFTVSGGDLALGANNITMSGSIGVTGTRVLKGWFTDLEVTNAIAGSVTGSAATVTGAAQASITSLGTLTALDVDNININGNTISSTAGTDLLITPLAGQQIVLDGAIIIDAGEITGITSLGVTGTRVTAGFFTDLTVTNAITGSVTGNAATVTGFTPASGSLTLAGADALTLTTSAATDVTLPTTGTLSAIAGTETLTNKRVTPRVTSEASSATPTINTDNSDAHSITALAAAITSMTTNLSGTPTNFQKLIIRFKDDGTARAITWGASFEAKGVALPTTTVISKVLTVGFIYDTVTSKWGCVASAQEA